MIFLVVGYAFQIYLYMIVVYALLSWFPTVHDSWGYRMIARCVEPYLSVFRNFIPPIGMIDVSSIVAMIALWFIQKGVEQVLVWFLI